MSIKVNQRYGKLTVLVRNGSNRRQDALWLCKCDCGNLINIKTGNLTTGFTKSCGCLKTGPKIQSLIGKKFNRFFVISYIGQDKWRSSLWECQCDCGKIVVISSTTLKSGHQKSCGCWNREQKQSWHGPANHNWNLNLTDKDRQYRRDQAKLLKDWSNAIRRKAKFKCQICLNKSNLIGHHLNGWDKFEQERFNIENGVCLCQDCHIDFHKKFGYGNNTIEQWRLYVLDRGKNYENRSPST